MNTQIYKTFEDHLSQRLKDRIYTTEDSVRYSFYASIVQHTSLPPSSIVLEYAHNTIPGAKIDTVIPNYNGQEVIIEFKYDRATPGGHNAPRPNKAGKLFNDIRRLLIFSANPMNLPAMRIFVYLTDPEMTSYMKNEQNNLSSFFQMPVGHHFTINEAYLANHCSTFQKAAGHPFNATAICQYSAGLPLGHQLRIYEVK